MPFYPIRNDITRMEVDAIVNAANRSLLGGGGVDGAIHLAAGPELLAECRTLGGCGTGDVRLTRGYRLPAKYIIHAVGPIYQDGRHGEETLLRSCYRKALEIAERKRFESIAFPLISSGAYGYPREECIRIAGEEITEFLKHSDMTVYLVFYDTDSFSVGQSQYPDLESKIEENEVRRIPNRRRSIDEEEEDGGSHRYGYSLGAPPMWQVPRPIHFNASEQYPLAAMKEESAIRYSGRSLKEKASPRNLNDALKDRDESFSEMLLRCITNSGMTDPECYRKANIDKKLFSKIRSNPDYKPSKPTVLAFAIALEMDREQTDILLKRAGFALNRSETFDIIVDYFISKGVYNLSKINFELFEHDQPLLGNALK